MTRPEIQQLQDQQALLTNALAAMLQGYWCGEPPSAAAYVSALNPSAELTCEEPWLSADEPPPPDQITWDPDQPMPGQLYDWTCSACATEWTERASGHSRGSDIYSNREAVVAAIGHPANINSTYGLMDGSGAQLQRVLAEQAGLILEHAYLSFDQAYAVFSHTYGLMSGAAYYHWVGVRGVSGSELAIANSAEGYKGVYSTMNRSQFNALGPFSILAVVGLMA
jgi:hypothetical protein